MELVKVTNNGLNLSGCIAKPGEVEMVYPQLEE
jgi:hypothetical protein